MFYDFIMSYVVEDYKYDYWHFPHLVSDLLISGDYLIDFRPKANYPGPFDAGGIPLLDLRSQHSETKSGTVYNPIVIAQYGLGWYSEYLHGQNKEALAKAVTVADWFMANGAPVLIDGKRAAALFFGYYDDGKVLSGMAQGLAISLLCRAYKETGRAVYLQKAHELYVPLTVNMEKGGVVDTSLGFPVLEEYTNLPIHILNGQLFAFMGIMDLKSAAKSEGDSDLSKSYDLHLESSVKLLRKSDMPFWSRYSLKEGILPNLTSNFYHRLHIELLKGLYLVTGRNEFKFYHDKWQRQRQSAVCRYTALALKLMDRIRY